MFFQILTNIPTVLKNKWWFDIIFQLQVFKSNVNLYFTYLISWFFPHHSLNVSPVFVKTAYTKLFCKGTFQIFSSTLVFWSILSSWKTLSFRAEKPYSIFDAQVSILDAVLCVSFQPLFFHLPYSSSSLLLQLHGFSFSLLQQLWGSGSRDSAGFTVG